MNALSAAGEELSLVRRHFFLVAAIAVLILMVVGGALRLAFPVQASPGGPQSASAGTPGGRSGGPAGPGGGGAAVTPTQAVMRTFTDRIEVLGVAKGRQSVTITSSATELVTRVRFRDGQRVQRGAILVDLQSSEEDANVTVASAGLNQAKRQYDRWRELAERGIAPRATAEQYQAAYEQAAANLRAAQSRRADRVIRAPFSGVVGLSDIAPGSLISPGGTIATLDDVSVIRVDFDIPDRYLAAIREGQAIVARPDALPGEAFSGRIAMLNTRIDERTRSIRGRAEISNAGGRLKPGMLVRVGIDRGQRQSMSVPEAAVLFEGDNPSVFVITKNGAKTVAEQRSITLGSNDGGFVEVRAGLRMGERIVADGLNRLQPGQPIRIAQARPGGPPSAAAAR